MERRSEVGSYCLWTFGPLCMRVGGINCVSECMNVCMNDDDMRLTLARVMSVRVAGFRLS